MKNVNNVSLSFNSPYSSQFMNIFNCIKASSLPHEIQIGNISGPAFTQHNDCKVKFSVAENPSTRQKNVYLEFTFTAVKATDIPTIANLQDTTLTPFYYTQATMNRP